MAAILGDLHVRVQAGPEVGDGVFSFEEQQRQVVVPTGHLLVLEETQMELAFHSAVFR